MTDDADNVCVKTQRKYYRNEKSSFALANTFQQRIPRSHQGGEGPSFTRSGFQAKVLQFLSI